MARRGRLPAAPGRLERWTYEPLHAAEQVAAEIDGAVAQFPVDNVKRLTSKGLSASSTFLTSAVGHGDWQREAACQCATKG